MKRSRVPLLAAVALMGALAVSRVLSSPPARSRPQSDTQAAATAPREPARPPAPPVAPVAPIASAPSDDARLLEAARRHARNVPVEVVAVVTKLLRDDTFGIAHQKFLVRAAGFSLLVAHNLDLAARAPVQPGDTVRIRGEYVWNEQGGVLHWTHRDPRGRHAAGFIEVRGQRIQ